MLTRDKSKIILVFTLFLFIVILMVYMCSLVTQIKREHNTIFALEKEIKANTILLNKKKELDDLDINIKEIDTLIEKEEIKKNKQS